MSEESVDFGPLEAMIGTWEGDKGLDVAPLPGSQKEDSPYFERIVVERVGDVENAKQQTLAIVRYHQVVRRQSNGEIFHDELGYWMWDAEQKIVMHSLQIPRAVGLLAGGSYDSNAGTPGKIKLFVQAKDGDADWGIVQSPFMQKNARTIAFRHEVTIEGDTLSYSETTVLDIYGKTFDHTDANVLTRKTGAEIKQDNTVAQVVELAPSGSQTSDNSPNIAGRKPIKAELKSGESYAWCSCGLSKNQPFCDGSHRSTSFKPKVFKVDEDQDAWLCMCKHSKNPPYCDGSHKNLPKPGAIAAEASSIPTGTEEVAEEPSLAEVKALAQDGLEKTGGHGEMVAMGVPRTQLPEWDDIQIMTAQMATKPLLEDEKVGTELIIGPKAKKPLVLDIPLFVSDMSFGALSEEAKIALARGAELAGTGICSGEGGMLPEEQAENSRYFYELASAQFGFSEDVLQQVQAFHFKGGQGAKTGTGGHLPGAKVRGKVAEVRGLAEGVDAISPSCFPEMNGPKDFKHFADRIREVSGGIPIGMKLSANHIERDIEFALQASADYLILDGRGGGTGAAPSLFRDHISVPTLPALARARRYLDDRKRHDVTLIITGGLRVPSDFIKAMCLGADGIAISNSALQSIGCVAARMCNTNLCPAGIATQKPELRAKLDIDTSAQQLERFFKSSTHLMQVMARACGHDHLSKFTLQDIATWKKEIAELTGIPFSGM
ncbi:MULTISPECIES: glutamate synthase-related protein [unclassified Oleiphilus]|uniref:glutamate synthase-related protein n=1 Tax=unclassified Oleiphilus TaxID=2631174 RepID=UPI0009EF40CB|nr:MULTISPECIES: glutamate synthase-related protein [unclassified Oleiphilus]